MSMKIGTVGIDVESTLTAVEGLDEIAATRGPDVLATIREITNRGMSGELSFRDSLEKRLRALNVNPDDIQKLQQLYLERMFDGAEKLVAWLQNEVGAKVALISGGLYDGVKVVADTLGVHELHAIEYDFNSGKVMVPSQKHGNLGHLLLDDFGKKQVMDNLHEGRGLFGEDSVNLMIGDGMTDARVKGPETIFMSVGERASVMKQADFALRTVADVRRMVEMIMNGSALPERMNRERDDVLFGDVDLAIA